MKKYILIAMAIGFFFTTIIMAAKEIVNAFIIFNKPTTTIDYEMSEEELEKFETIKFNQELQRYFTDHKECDYLND
jgi:hypothetical protein